MNKRQRKKHKKKEIQKYEDTLMDRLMRSDPFFELLKKLGPLPEIKGRPLFCKEKET